MEGSSAKDDFPLVQCRLVLSAKIHCLLSGNWQVRTCLCGSTVELINIEVLVKAAVPTKQTPQKAARSHVVIIATELFTKDPPEW